MELVLLPLASIAYSVAVTIIQPKCSNSMPFAVQPVSLILVFVGIDNSTSSCTIFAARLLC